MDPRLRGHDGKGKGRSLMTPTPETRRATQVLRAGDWPAGSEAASVTLAFHERHRRRRRFVDDAGRPFLLDLETAIRFEEGDGLRLEDGAIILVRAAVEPVADITAGSPEETARIAWHIGNRHVPMQVLEGGRLRIGDDHVLVAMVEGLGATVSRHEAAFAPESGAYASGEGASHGHGHGHHHHHDDDDDHDHHHHHHHAHG